MLMKALDIYGVNCRRIVNKGLGGFDETDKNRNRYSSNIRGLDEHTFRYGFSGKR